MRSHDTTRIHDFLSYGDHADLFFENTRFTTIRWEEGKVEEVSIGRDSGFSLRYLLDGQTFFTHANSSEQGLIEAEAGKLITHLPRKNISLSAEQPHHYRHPMAIDPTSISLEQKIQLLGLIHTTIQQTAAEITQVILYYGEKSKDTTIFTASSAPVTEERTYCVLMLSVIASAGGLLQTATELIGGIGGYELMDEEKILRKATQVAQRAKSKLSAPQAPAGEMPVVISSEAGGTMIHEAVGHSLEADAVQKGISPVYHGRINMSVASPLITVMDDPTIPGRRGSYAFDDEGVASIPTTLIENGILKTYLYDRSTAAQDKVFSNGHGRRQSYRERPIPRMANTFIKPGSDTPADIIHSLSDGLLVIKMGGGQVNTATGDFVFEVEEGYHVQNGSIKQLVRGANLLGNGPEVLASIDRVGSDLGWGLGTCGKDGQGVPVSDAQPTLRIKKLLVGGNQ